MVFILVVTVIKNRFGVGIAVCAGVVRGGSDGSRISVHIGWSVVVDCEMIVIGRVDAGIVVCHCIIVERILRQRSSASVVNGSILSIHGVVPLCQRGVRLVKNGREEILQTIVVGPSLCSNELDWLLQEWIALQRMKGDGESIQVQSCNQQSYQAYPSEFDWQKEWRESL